MGFRQNLINLITRKSWYGIARSVLSDEKLNWDKFDFLTANEISLYLNRAIAKRAEKAAEIQFVLEKDDEIIEEHPLLDLLKKPNSYMTSEQFWALYQKYKDLTGSVFIYLEKEAQIFSEAKINAMHLLRPDMTSPVVKDGVIVAFEYTRPNGTKTSYSPDEIIYDYYPDPMNPFFGQSLLKAGARAIDTEVQISQYHSKILRNGGKVEGVFKFKTPSLSEKQLKEIKKSYEDQFAGASKAGKPLFLGGDAEYQKIGMTPDELSYLAAKNISLSDICILTGVPKPLLASLDEIKFDNADAAQMIFLRDTIWPLDKAIATKLDEDLFPDDMKLRAIDPTPENKDEKRKDAETLNSINALTTNEKRELFGYDRIETDEADQVLIPFNMTPLTADPTANAPVPTKSKSKKKSHPLRDSETRLKYGIAKVAQMSTHKRRAVKAMKAYFRAQEKRLVERLQTIKSFKKKSLLDEMFDSDLEISLAQSKILDIIRDALSDSGQSTADLVDGNFIITHKIGEWLDQRSHLFAKQITDTSYAKLSKAFAESLEAGESRAELLKRINDIYDGWSTSRANVIANTEVHGSFQFGAMEGYRQSNVDIKIWVWAPGSKGGVRDDHLEIDGEEQPLDLPFSNGLMFPGDPGGDPADTVSCECTI